MEGKDKVSIVMSCLNTPKDFLDLAIESLLNQTYKNIEFIFINNGGNNFEQLKSYELKDKRVKVVNNKITLELPEALNLGIEMASGTYIARMDSDDYSMPDRIKTQVDFLNKNTSIDVCSMYAGIFGARNGLAVYPWCKKEDVKAMLFFSNEIYHPTVMFRKDFLDKYYLRYRKGINYSEDFDMWNRCCEKGSMEIIPLVGILYRIHNMSASITGNQIQVKSKEKVLAYNLSLLSVAESNLKYINCLCNDNNADINGLCEFILLVLKQNKIIQYYKQEALQKTLYRPMCKIIIKRRFNGITFYNACICFWKSHLIRYIIAKWYKKNYAKARFKKSYMLIPGIIKKKLFEKKRWENVT